MAGRGRLMVKVFACQTENPGWIPKLGRMWSQCFVSPGLATAGILLIRNKTTLYTTARALKIYRDSLVQKYQFHVPLEMPYRPKYHKQDTTTNLIHTDGEKKHRFVFYSNRYNGRQSRQYKPLLTQPNKPHISSVGTTGQNANSILSAFLGNRGAFDKTPVSLVTRQHCLFQSIYIHKGIQGAWRWEQVTI